jgi:hypothetical protein
VALGVELYQLDDAGEHGVIGFASRMLRGPELLYTVTEKELLAIIFGLQKFRTILLGHRIVIRTDHYALKFLKQCRLLNDRLTRWSLLLNEFDYDVEHIRGKDNVVADTLSRFPPDMGSVPIRGPNVPIVGATVMSEVDNLHFFSAVFTASGLGELQAHFQNPDSCRLMIRFWARFSTLGSRGACHPIMIDSSHISGFIKTFLSSSILSIGLPKLHFQKFWLMTSSGFSTNNMATLG